MVLKTHTSRTWPTFEVPIWILITSRSLNLITPNSSVGDFVHRYASPICLSLTTICIYSPFLNRQLLLLYRSIIKFIFQFLIIKIPPLCTRFWISTLPSVGLDPFHLPSFSGIQLLLEPYRLLFCFWLQFIQPPQSKVSGTTKVVPRTWFPALYDTMLYHEATSDYLKWKEDL